jgi:hypothetical protein
MKIQVFALYDSAAGIYSQPNLIVSEKMAIRAFEEACRDPQSLCSKYPADQSLWHLGCYDDAAGTFENLKVPLCLARAHEVIAAQKLNSTEHGVTH